MGLCSGDEIDYTELLPEELQNLRKQLAAFASAKMGAAGTSGLQTATPYLGPMSTGLDPMSLMAANIMMAYGNQLPYMSPTMFSGSQMTPYGSMPGGEDKGGGGGGKRGGGGSGGVGGYGGGSGGSDVGSGRRGRKRTREYMAT